MNAIINPLFVLFVMLATNFGLVQFFLPFSCSFCDGFMWFSCVSWRVWYLYFLGIGSIKAKSYDFMWLRWSERRVRRLGKAFQLSIFLLLAFPCFIAVKFWVYSRPDRFVIAFNMQIIQTQLIYVVFGYTSYFLFLNTKKYSMKFYSNIKNNSF